jgi:hypothetical protein
MLRVTGWIAGGLVCVTLVGFVGDLEFFAQRLSGLDCRYGLVGGCAVARPFVGLRLGSVAIGLVLLLVCSYLARRERRETPEEEDPADRHVQRAATRAVLASGLGFMIAIQLLPFVYNPETLEGCLARPGHWHWDDELQRCEEERFTIVS